MCSAFFNDELFSLDARIIDWFQMVTVKNTEPVTHFNNTYNSNGRVPSLGELQRNLLLVGISL